MSAFRSIARAVRTGYRRMFKRQEDAHLREIIATLRQVPLFQGLSGSALREVAEVIHYRTYRREEFLYHEHDPGLGMYIVQRGRVRLLAEENGALHELRQLGENKFFGELSLLGAFRRLESAQAVTETQALGFFRPDLRVLLKRHPQTGADVVLALARMLATRQANLAETLTEDESRTAALKLLDGAAAWETA